MTAFEMPARPTAAPTVLWARDGVIALLGRISETEEGPARWPQLRRRQRAAGTELAVEALGRLTGVAPSCFSLERSAGAPPRPVLAGRAASGLYVSISHSEGWVAVAAARCPVGIDLERDIEGRHLDGLAFAPNAFEPLSGRAQIQARTRAWCVLEAESKRRGIGLTVPFAELSPPSSVRVETGRLGDFAWALSWGDSGAQRAGQHPVGVVPARGGGDAVEPSGDRGEGRALEAEGLLEV